MTSRILFVAVEGVLTSARSAVGLGGTPTGANSVQHFDQAAVGLLRAAAAKCDARLVLIGDWRERVPHRRLAVALGLPFIDAAPIRPPSARGAFRLEQPLVLGMEIDAWLEGRDDAPEYAILESSGDVLDDQLPSLIQTSGDDGFSWQDYVDLLGLFDIEP